MRLVQQIFIPLIWSEREINRYHIVPVGVDLDNVYAKDISKESRLGKSTSLVVLYYTDMHFIAL